MTSVGVTAVPWAGAVCQQQCCSRGLARGSLPSSPQQGSQAGVGTGHSPAVLSLVSRG